MVNKYSQYIGYIDFNNALNHKYFKQEFIDNSWGKFYDTFDYKFNNILIDKN